MGTVSAVLSILLVLLKAFASWAERQDAAALRESGQAEEIARVSARILVTLEKANAVDAALSDGHDAEWLSRLEKRARAGSGADAGTE